MKDRRLSFGSLSSELRSNISRLFGFGNMYFDINAYQFRTYAPN